MEYLSIIIPARARFRGKKRRKRLFDHSFIHRGYLLKSFLNMAINQALKLKHFDVAVVQWGAGGLKKGFAPHIIGNLSLLTASIKIIFQHF